MSKLDLRYIRTMSKRVWKKVTYDPVGWRKYPRVIQIDTNNHCGPAYSGILCEYCYPQWIVKRELRKHTEMPMEHIEWIIKESARDGKQLKGFDCFLNGDGLTDERLPEIFKMCKRYCPSVNTQTFTCGVNSANLSVIVDQNLDSVCFTISGHNRDLYKNVHHGDKFDTVMSNLRWVLEHKHSAQHVEVHCVVTRTNVQYMKEWWNVFEFIEKYGARRVLSPLVASESNIPSKIAATGLDMVKVENEIYNITGERGFMWLVEHIRYPDPCVLWHNCSFDVEGYFLQCCNWCDPKLHNYGLISDLISEGRHLKDVWQERLANRMRNPLCRSCNMKHPEWQKRLANMKLRVSA